jgi:carbonic anhydrase
MGSERQSPVDIPTTAPLHEPDVEWSYQSGLITFGDNPIADQFDVAPGSQANIDGLTHRLLQFHFHSPAEHRLDGRRAPMELHLVHEAADGSLAAIGAWIAEGAHNPDYDAVVAALSGATPGVAAAPIDPSSLLPGDRRYVAYMGSLTTPPYTEGVAWHMLLQPVAISRPQIDAIAVGHHGNSRPPQPMGGRSFT